ncbi:MAG: methylated-DNA--[protein]-cysteine S-methyltransferase [Bacteroidetes bacterium]|nr:methylated-DNA--[protein]-cysteine S-methyltransferase [Bacteroidota bacterium]
MIIDTPIGKCQVVYDDTFICEIRWENEIIEEKQYPKNNLSDKIKMQFNEYFTAKRKEFTLPVKLNVRGFSADCLNFIFKHVKYGKTTTYKDIAIALGSPNAARAVGNAMNKNPIPIIIPCHRVVGSNGKLVGFRSGLDNKKWLLDFEKNN